MIKKDIIIFEDSSKSAFGGGQKVTLHTINALSKYANLFLIDCTNHSKFYNQAIQKIKASIVIKNVGSIKGGHKSSFSVSIWELAFTFISFPYNILSIREFIKKNTKNHDVILYVTTNKMLLIAWVLKKCIGYNFIFHAHSYDSRKNIFHLIRKYFSLSAETVICVSNSVKNNLEIKNAKVLYNPVSLNKNNPKFKLTTCNKRFIVASFSTLIPWKGIVFFMLSYQYLKTALVEYWIFGEGDEKKNLMQFSNENVKLKGFSENTNEILKQDVHLVVVPSISEEACPMVPLEAFSHGIPVITTNFGGQAEVVVDNYVGLHCLPRDPKSIADKIDLLYESPELYKQLSSNALEYSKKFSFKIFREKILEVFNTVPA